MIVEHKSFSIKCDRCDVETKRHETIGIAILFAQFDDWFIELDVYLCPDCVRHDLEENGVYE